MNAKRFMPLALTTLCCALVALPAAVSQESDDGTTAVDTGVREPAGWKGLPGAKDPGEPGKAPGWVEVELKVTPAPKDWGFRTPLDAAKAGRTNRGAWIDVSGGTLPYVGAKGGQAIRFWTGVSRQERIDLDGDGQGETSLQELLAAKIRRPDGSEGAHHFRLRRDGDQYLLNRACMAVGKIDDVPIAFIDEDNNGNYGDNARDALRIGAAPVAQYMSEVINVKNSLYYLRVNQAGTMAWYKPYEGPTGTIDLVSGYRGKSKPLFAMIKQGEIIVDAGAGKDLMLPVGSWDFFEGIVGPSIHQSAKILPGRMTPLVVRTGEPTSLKWGMQGIIEFFASKEGNLLKISSTSVRIYGQGGEEYQDFRPKKFTPNVRVVDERSKRDLIYKNMGAGC